MFAIRFQDFHTNKNALCKRYFALFNCTKITTLMQQIINLSGNIIGKFSNILNLQTLKIANNNFEEDDIEFLKRIYSILITLN